MEKRGVTPAEMPDGGVQTGAAEGGFLAAGTRWQTPLYVVDGEVDGPTVLLVAGIHGDEAAGPVAVERMRTWRLERGRLLLVPQANRPALSRSRRRAPGTPFGDLNRNFPRSADDAPRGKMARALWDVVLSIRPDWVLDLHEGFDVNRQNKRSVGSSVLYVPVGEHRRQAERLAHAVNATLDPERHFTLLRWPAKGSLSRAAWDQLGISGMILETTKNEQPLECRVAQHELMVGELLLDLAMLAGSGSPGEPA